MRSHYRCKECRTRHVFHFAPDSYAKPKKCRHCGSTAFRLDGWMNNRDTKAMACTCKGYVPFTRNPKTTVWEIHRKGSPYCWFRKDGTQRMEGDADFRDVELERWAAEGGLQLDHATEQT